MYYRRPEPFDWYQVYSGIKDIISQYITKNDKILNLGCGNSRLSEELSEEGFEDITNIDFSNKVITIMEEKCKAKYPKMSFKVMDALDMKEFQTGYFNTVIDKGTLDSVLCADNAVPNAQKMISEVFRVLAPGGHYICITYGDPEHRKKHFETKTWEKILTEKINKPATSAKESKNPPQNNTERNFHYVYILTKKKNE